MNEILIAVVVFGAYCIEGLTGFGGAIVALPFLSALVGLPGAVTFALLASALFGLYTLVRRRRQVDWKQFGAIVLLMAAGVPVGLLLGEYMPERWLKLALGIFTVVVGLWGLLQPAEPACAGKDVPTGDSGKETRAAEGGRPYGGRNDGGEDAHIAGDGRCDGGEVKTKLGREDPAPADGRREVVNPAAKRAPLWMKLCVVGGGVLQGAFATGGPLMVVYAKRMIPDKERFRATLPCVWLVLNSVLLAVRWRAGALGDISAFALPALAAWLGGIVVGSLLCKRVDAKLFSRIVDVVLLGAGAYMTVANLL